MNRFTAAIAAVLLGLAGSARADEQPAPPASPTTEGDATEAPVSSQPAIDLFPTQVLAANVAGRPPLSISGPRPAPETIRTEIRFNTGSWKGEAAMGAALVGGFAALVGVCRGGRCMKLFR